MEKSTGRKTRQLEVVWHEVAGDKSHPTAHQIYQRVRRHIPNISLCTVYHNLQKLVAERKLQVLTLLFQLRTEIPGSFGCLKRCRQRTSTRLGP